MLNELRAYFYLIEGEQMPPDAPDEWFLLPDPGPRSLEQVEVFTSVTRRLITAIAECNDTEEDIQSVFYEHAKIAFGDERSAIREYFQMLYVLVFHRLSGPRRGQFVSLIGRQAFIERLEQRLDMPMQYPI